MLELCEVCCDRAMVGTVCGGFHGLSGRDDMMYGLDTWTGMLIAA